MPHEMSDEELEDRLHRAFLHALRVMYEAHDLDVDIAQDPAWDLLKEIAAGSLTLYRTPAEFLPADASEEVHAISLEETHKIMREGRTTAQMILAAHARFLSGP